MIEMLLERGEMHSKNVSLGRVQNKIGISDFVAIKKETLHSNMMLFIFWNLKARGSINSGSDHVGVFEQCHQIVSFYQLTYWIGFEQWCGFF